MGKFYVDSIINRLELSHTFVHDCSFFILNFLYTTFSVYNDFVWSLAVSSFCRQGNVNILHGKNGKR